MYKNNPKNTVFILNLLTNFKIFDTILNIKHF